MSPKSFLFVMACLAVVAGCTSVPNVARQNLDEQVRAITPGLKLTFDDTLKPHAEPLRVRRFSYVSTFANWPYGNGIAIGSRSSDLLWVYLHDGDYPPHSISWADFDGDGRHDIFFHAGMEDVFSTRVFLNRIATPRFGLSQFVSGYTNEEVYATVVDLDADGLPELLVPDRYMDEEDPCGEALRVLERRLGSRQEYERVVGRYDGFNFKFGLPAEEYSGLQLFANIEVKSFGRALVETKVQQHLEWRLKALAAATQALDGPCRTRAVDAADHLRSVFRDSLRSN